ncbi:penicillin-binding protein [Marinomonas pollencensis]|uniref:Penicillin-binding protein n=1 Tax=Marinomonas pollencensis TaxID=491954 RepID=A0A3E0DSV3_9GAMM|nr:penicillin-binding protein [Marinomonas pollencensis]REG86627.1 hypothetical protein DFP81_101192 [Marinomonas pollencensis]
MKEDEKQALLDALKVAFCYMPKAIEVNKYEYGDRYQLVLNHVESVREVLLMNDIDPDEVDGEVNSDIAPNSTY